MRLSLVIALILAAISLILLLIGVGSAANPTVDSIEFSTTLTDPEANTTITTQVSDADGISTVADVEWILYASVTSKGAADSTRNHYTVQYNRSQDSWSISPSGYAYGVNGLADDSGTTGTLQFNWKPHATAFPTANTANATQNAYNWVVNTTATDNTSAVGYGENTTEVNMKLSLSLNVSTISFAGQPGDTNIQSDTNVLVSNTGNVNIDLDYSGTNYQGQTDPSYSIAVGNTNMTAPSKGTATFSTSTQTWAVGIAWGENLACSFYLDFPIALLPQSYQGTLTLSAKEA